jgi:hypothetical protein
VRLIDVRFEEKGSLNAGFGKGKTHMDDENLLQAVWKRIQARPRWLAASGRRRGHDDLEQWLTLYRMALARAVHGTQSIVPQPPRRT